MAGYRFAVVVSRFNEEITEGLLQGARERLAEASVPEENVTIIRVPGAFEIPIAGQRLGESGEYDAVICLGCVIKGETMHFEYIAEATSHGIMQAAAATGIPMAFGVLTTLTEEQALERSAQLNRAYKTFQNPSETIRYVLLLKGLMEEDEKYELSPGFLMEVLEINEQLMEADDPETRAGLQLAIDQLQSEIYAPVKEIVEHYQEGVTSEKELLQVKEYYYQQKYLDRIRRELAAA